jgi:hypothetical protein
MPDVAIFDWAEEVTDNMRWELHQAHQRLPGDRILVVYDPRSNQAVAEFVDLLNESNDRSIRTLELSRKRDDQYIWPNNGIFEKGFREEYAGSWRV